MYSAELNIENQEQLPAPKGYKLLIAIPEIKAKTDGGIIIPDLLKDAEKTASIYGNVIAMGPDAYGDAAKFPSGPYCEVGDWVVFRSYTGTRLKVNGNEFRVINDDSVEAVVPDPRAIRRV
jgi:chaperonin GroES